MTTKEIKKIHSSRLVGGAEISSWVKRTCSKAAAGLPSEVADCGVGWAKLQLAIKAAADRPDDRPRNPEFQLWEIKPQTSELRRQQRKLPVSQESSLERPTGA